MERVFTASEKTELLSLDVGSLNEVQTEALSLLRAEVSAELAAAPPNDDTTGDRKLLRIMRRCKFDLIKSAAMLRTMLEWRRQNGIDSIRDKILETNPGTVDTKWFPLAEKIQKFYPIMFTQNTDKSGHPMLMEKLGEIRASEIMKAITIEELLTYHVHCLESINLVLDQQSVESGKLAQAFMIIDLTGLGMDVVNLLPWISRIGQCTQDYYPDLSYKVLICNAPWSFYSVWSVIQTWLPEATKKKIAILDANYQSTLLENVDEDKLPAFAGGTCEYDSYGFRLTDHTGELAGAREIVVAAGGREVVTIPVGSDDAPGAALIDVKVRCAGGMDISFGVSFTPAGGSGGMEQLKEPQRISNQAEVYKAAGRGRLLLIFDNSYSYVRNKSVSFKVDFMPMDQFEGTKLAAMESEKIEEETETAEAD
jgi:hypothetical protein